MKKLLLTLFLLLLSAGVYAQSDDIPNNCRYQHGAFFNVNLFPRYEFNNQRVVLVDWSSGAEVRELATSISGGDYRVMGWSPECQYLSIAFSHLDEQNVQLWDTYVWDVVAGGQIAYFPDARLSPYPMTWDTNSTQILVETRFGAYLWKLEGGQVWLTSEADYNSRSFRQGTVQWDYAANQVSGVLSIPPFGTAIYDLSSGTLVAISDRFNEALDIESNNVALAQATENGERYPCRRTDYYRSDNYRTGLRLDYEPTGSGLVLRDYGTREIIDVVDATLGEVVGNVRITRSGMYLNCRFLYVAFGQYELTTAIYDLESHQRVLLFENTIVHELSFDPTGTRAVITTRNGANLYNLVSGLVVPLVPNTNVRPGAIYDSIWTFDTIEWDLENNQIRLGSDIPGFYLGNRIYQTQIFDLSTGALVSVVDQYGEPLLSDQIESYANRRTAPYGCRWDVQYQFYNQRLVLADFITNDLLTVVEDQLDLPNFRYLGRSPDCRYIAAAVNVNDVYETYVWDLANSGRVGTFPDAREVPHQLDWSPYGGLLLVHTRNGAFLWDLETDSRTQLNNVALNDNAAYWREAVVRNFSQLEWNMEIGELLGVPLDQPDRVVAYDLITGQVRAEYPLEAPANPVSFMRVDNQRLLVYTSDSARSGIQSENGMAIWDEASGNGIQLAMPNYVTPRRNYLYYRAYPQFSPDGGLMLMLGYGNIYIWDFNNLSGESPHLPNYVHELSEASDAHFVDNSTIQTCDQDTLWHLRYPLTAILTYYDFDAITGAQIGESQETVYYYNWPYSYDDWRYNPCA